METTSGPNANMYSVKYIRILKLFLWTIGAWPGENLGEKVPFLVRYHRKHLPIQTIILLLGQINYLVHNLKILNFFILGHMYITCFLSVLTTARCSLANFKGYGVVSKKFLTNFHLVHFKHKSEIYAEMCNKVNKVSYIFTLYLSAMMVLGMLLFNITPNYNNFRNGAFTGGDRDNMTLEFSVYWQFPKFRQEQYFFFITIYNTYLSYCCAVSVCAIDLFLSLIVFQIIGHIQVLRENLKTLPKPQKQIVSDAANGKENSSILLKIYDATENVAMHKKLVEFVEHHMFIVSFTDDVSNFYGPTLALYYLFHLVSGCLLLLECSTGDPNAIARYGPLTIIIFGQLMQISIIFEIVGYVSEKLIDSVYLIPWESMNVVNMKVFKFFLMRVQNPIQVTAMGMTPVGVQTMASILKTSFSYFMFLKSKQ